MKIVRNTLLLAATYSMLGPGAGVSQQNGGSASFALELTASHVKGHSDQWDFANPDRAVLARDVVEIAVRKTNRSDHEIDKSFLWGDGRDGYQLDVRGSSGALLKPNIHVVKAGDPGPGGPLRIIGSKDMVLQPGESYVERDFVSGHPFLGGYDLSQPGKYTIEVWEPVSDKPDAQIVKSNTVTLTVVPKNTPLFDLLLLPEHIDVSAGNDVAFNIEKTNTSLVEQDCSRLRDPVTSLDLRYQYTVLDNSGSPVPKLGIDQPAQLSQGAVSEAQTCKTGQVSFSPRVVISKLYDLNRPGNYTVQVSQPMSNNPADGVVKSNVLSITVSPASAPK